MATTRSLLAIANHISRAGSPHQIAQVVTELVQDVFGADVSAVQLRRPDGSFYLAHAAGEMTGEEREILRTRRFSHPSHAIMARERRVIAIDDVPTSGLADPRYLVLIRRVSTLLVPFVRGEELLGYWGIHYIRERHHWTSWEIALAEGIGGHAAMALDNLRLREAERGKSARLEAVHAVTTDILARRDLVQVLDAVVEHSLRLTGRAHGGVMLWDEAERGLRVVASRGKQGNPVGSVSKSSSLGFEAYRQNRALVANDYQSYASSDVVSRSTGVQAAVSVPLRAGADPIGVLTVSDRRKGRPFNAGDIHTLELLAAPAAIAIEKARLLQREREAARLEGAVQTARGVAHELNQPLGIIAGQAEVLRTMVNPLTPVVELEESLADIQEAAARLASNVLRLQGIVRLETREVSGIGPYIDLERSSGDEAEPFS